jgi:hypothetical protein
MLTLQAFPAAQIRQHNLDRIYDWVVANQTPFIYTAWSQS